MNIKKLFCNSYKHRLYTPTYITKEILGNSTIFYFIVDCWHHRVIYTKNINLPINKWDILTDDIAGPHSLASDGELIITEDTGRNALMVFKYMENGKFNYNQYIQNIGSRPHKTIYDNKTKLFYSIGSFSQNIIAIKNDSGTARIKYNINIPELRDCYIRSIKIIDDKMYFVSAHDEIIVCDYINASYEVIDKIKIGSEFAGANDLWKYEDYYYLTSTPKKFIRFKHFDDIESGNYEDLYSKIQFKGTPYYIQEFDNRFYLPEISEYSRINSFKIDNNEIKDIQTLIDCGQPTESSINRFYSMPK